MGDKSHGTGEPGDQDKDKGTPLSNSDVKAHPLFKKLTQELAEERKANKATLERLDALETAENRRATKAAEAKKDYQEALDKRIDQAKKDARKEWDAEQAIKDKRAAAKLELVKAGFKNERFLKGALSDFDPGNQTAEEFAKSLMEDDSNKPFLDTGKGPGKPPDPHPTPRSGSKLLTPAEIQALRASSNPDDRTRADDAAEALWLANNGTTGLPT